ncbi:MAG: hypothetical protein KBS95_08485 [Alistipes sp.]|nr:hypothetical protein [Candidatus Alistipes equi]
MKKIFSIAILAAAFAMVGCAGNANKKAEEKCDCCKEKCEQCQCEAAPAEAAPAEAAPAEAPAEVPAEVPAK